MVNKESCISTRLQKMALTWYMHTATAIQQGDWNQEQTLFLDYFRPPSYQADRQVLAMSRKQGEKETNRDFANEKIRLETSGPRYY